MKETSLCLAIVATALLTAACGNSALSSGTFPSQPSAQDQLLNDREAMNQALADAGIPDVSGSSSSMPSGSMTISCPSGSGATPAVSSAFTNLQTDLTDIEGDAQAQNSSALTSDMQQFQADLLSDLSSLLNQISACLQVLPTPPPGSTTSSSQGGIAFGVLSVGSTGSNASSYGSGWY